MPLRSLYHATALAIMVPLAIFLLINTQFGGGSLYRFEFLHAIIIMGTSIFAIVISFFGYKAYVSSADLRLIFIIFGFLIYGVISSLHILAGISYFHTVLSHSFFEISEHSGLFFVSLLIIFGSSLPLLGASSAVYKMRLYILGIIAVVISAFFLIIYYIPEIAMIIESYMKLVIIMTSVLFVWSMINFLELYRLSPSRCAVFHIIGLGVLTSAVVISFFYEQWDVFWWYYHALIIVGFSIMSFGMITRWRQEFGKSKIKKFI